ncbi:NAD(P)/FAD-dependent oxidoreductase [Roseibium album]|uniref:D-amino acid dehydrogenase small subunit n=1 Tax=Roseibium album TaxID=311410 RepID=A0A0M6ZQQ8_9HYPH|nr:FAD-binding oxidoreductase [Roseibium album]CTQ59259.1 D-amino acid dehydrogenase small subunit [Roseibium album]CTQ64582.1 D-amino acid dehydrogenase small subunit [Roseibium album]CTQ74450.1 D-amino acid dehydrogenase small subunit [Roseibium album]
MPDTLAARQVAGMGMTRQAGQLRSFDVLVLGAGIVGVSTAIHLRRLGLDVALIDRKHPGVEASFGNAGIVQCNGFVPHAIPSRPSQLIGIMLGQSSAVSYDFSTLVRLFPWLRQYHAASSGRGIETYSRAIAPLRALAVQDHLDLAAATLADRYYRKGGWLHLYRGEGSFRQSEIERHYARVYGVAYEELTTEDTNVLEPGLSNMIFKAVHWTESCSVSNPGAVVDAFWRGFVQDGGHSIRGDARKLQKGRGEWSLDSERGTITAPNVVVALGAWSSDLLAELGEHYPLVSKRGYHMHFQPRTGASLSRPVVDVENGFALTPTDNGIRLTTGVELVDRDAPPNPNIIKLTKRRASELFPLGQALQDQPWLGSRPCLPDSLPVCGQSSKTSGLWLNFGHGHDGFTLGPVTGRLLAEQIAGKESVQDLTAFSPARFPV